MASIEVKIRKLDGELARYKEQMAKLRNGPGKVSIRPFILLIHHPIICPSILSTGRDSATRPAHTKAKTHVRSPDRAADTADV